MGQTSQPLTAYPETQTEGSTSYSNRLKAFIALAVLLGAFGYLGFIAFQSATMYYLTVSELQAVGPTEDARLVRVSGKLIPGSFERDPGSTQAHFSLTEGGQVLKAVHEGVVPDLFFNEHSEIILEGIYNTDEFFESQNVIVKCPSKYVSAS